MLPTDPVPADPRPEISLAAEQERVKQAMKALGRLVERITPWLVDFGSWIFGGLIAFTLLVMASLFTIGPVDPATMVATTTFALALPLDVAGLFLLRLRQDLAHIGYEEEVAQAFQEVGFTTGPQVPTLKSLEVQRKGGTRVTLLTSLGILALSAILTVTGLIATLWHMAWWIGVAFITMVLICLGIVIVVFVASQPPDSAEEKERKRHYRQEILRQAKEAKAQSKKKK
jgi:hypothetical protein